MQCSFRTRQPLERVTTSVDRNRHCQLLPGQYGPERQRDRALAGKFRRLLIQHELRAVRRSNEDLESAVRHSNVGELLLQPVQLATEHDVDAGGNLTVAIQGDSNGGGPVAYATRFDSQTKSWSVPAQLNGTATVAAGGVSLAVDAHGTVLGGWGRQGASSFVTPMCAL